MSVVAIVAPAVSAAGRLLRSLAILHWLRSLALRSLDWILDWIG